MENQQVQTKGPYFRLWTNDFITGTMYMEADEVGAYIRLLTHQWETGPIPNENRLLKRITGVSVKRLEHVLEKFHLNDEGKWVNLRLEEERVSYTKFVNRQRQKSQIAAEKRKAYKDATEPVEEQETAKETIINYRGEKVEFNTPGILENARYSTKTFSLQDVKECFVKMGVTNEAMPLKFFNNYEAKGWLIGRTPITKIEPLVNSWVLTEQKQQDSAATVEPLIDRRAKVLQQMKSRSV